MHRINGQITTVSRAFLVLISFAQVVLEQAWNQGIRPILVLNKIDRLILEKKLEPADAYAHISQVLEQVPVPVNPGLRDRLFSR
jgi:translation elongation factor EF-G